MEQKNQKNNINLYSVLINFFSKKGDYAKTRSIINKTFFLLSKKLRLPVNRVVLKLFLFLYTYLEVKQTRMRRRFNIVPFSVRRSRRCFLVLKKMRSSLKKKMSLSSRLYTEVLNVLSRRSRSKEIKDTTISQAYTNRSKTHFRWFF